jgi:endo-1,4-beta-mannosidase
MRRNTVKVTADGRAVSWLGANFWSRTGGPLMWRNYDPQVVREELRVLRDHGLGMTRSFFYWPDFMPEPDLIDEKMTARFADFLDRHTEAGMTTIPTFIVGHMSGENWDPAWRHGRDLYSDVWMVARQAWFAGEMVRRFGAHPAVCGWLVTNEMPIYGGDDTPSETVAAWAQIMIDAIRAAGGSQPVSLGDGAWGIEVRGDDNGFSVADSARLCDFLGPHAYPVGNDQARLHYAAAWACELAGTFGRPVVLEEFGVSSDFASDENAAHYYRQALNNSLLAGATGWIGWCNSDYDDLVHQDPYAQHPFELHFGLTRSDGTPKPQLAELKRFADLLAAIDIGRCERADTDAALIVPSYLDTKYPFTSPRDRAYVRESLGQAYVATRLADLPVALTRESDGITHGARLYLLPSAKQLLGPTWRELEAIAADGATVYVSYSPGDNGHHPGPWYAHLNAMFGIQHQLRNGLVDPIEDEQVTLTFGADFGTLAAGSVLTFSVAGNEYGRAYLPVRPDGAEVIAVDGRGRPALLARRVGAGSVVLCTYPLEHMAAMTPRVNPEATSTLYDALAAYAGVSRLVTVDDPRIAADVMVRSDGARFAWLVSQAAEHVTVKPQLAAGLRLCPLDGGPADGGPADGGPADGTVTLDPFGVSVFAMLTGTGSQQPASRD